MPRIGTSGFRRWFKWGGLILSVLTLAVWVGSAWWYFARVDANGYVYCSYGKIVYWKTQKPPRFFAPGISISLPGKAPAPPTPPAWPKWIFEKSPSWVQYAFFCAPRVRLSEDPKTVWVPLWCPFIAMGCLTAFLWWRDRSLPGHCKQCGYNLYGNVSGRCPECGTATTQHGLRPQLV